MLWCLGCVLAKRCGIRVPDLLTVFQVFSCYVHRNRSILVGEERDEREKAMAECTKEQKMVSALKY